MPRVIFQVDEHTRALMVEAAHRELVSLSEWLRRAAEVRLNGGLAAGDEPGAVNGPSAGSVPAAARDGDAGPTGSEGPKAATAPAPAASPRCTREARHHINHTGKPCPECGYPAT